jgi:predicted  nucleic acid-binding Zn-ribbon protein
LEPEVSSDTTPLILEAEVQIAELERQILEAREELWGLRQRVDDLEDRRFAALATQRQQAELRRELLEAFRVAKLRRAERERQEAEPSDGSD